MSTLLEMRYDLAKSLMDRFADATGLTSASPPRRYLWTDAFAVCNFLTMYRVTGLEHYAQQAVKLVDQVHHVLGRHRPDDVRSGWISGLSDADAVRHPTRGGLRIGKKLNERRPDQPPDSRLEWDRDGQYFHYLTKWMHTLARVGQELEEPRYIQWAVELATVAHRSFTYQPQPHGPKRMYWKMSIDLSRPLASSMGHHDPLDGLVTSLDLRTDPACPSNQERSLDAAIADFSEMCRQKIWATDDPLGVGGLLFDALRLAEMIIHRGVQRHDLLVQLIEDAAASLRAVARLSPLQQSPQHRLAFRELGLSIGLHGLSKLRELTSHEPLLQRMMQDLLRHQPLCDQIEATWSDPVHQQSNAWREHCDINAVMLATSLAPDAFLML